MPVSVWRRTPQPCFPSRRGRSASRPHAAPWGHFASLVRSIASQSARLPAVRRRRISPQSLDCVRVRSHRGPRLCAEGARLRGRSPPRLARARGRFRAAVTPPPLARSARGARLIRPWAASGLVGIPPVAACRPLSAMRASRRPGALRPRSRLASAGALVAHVGFCGARSAPLAVSKMSALPLNCVQLWGQTPRNR